MPSLDSIRTKHLDTSIELNLAIARYRDERARGSIEVGSAASRPVARSARGSSRGDRPAKQSVTRAAGGPRTRSHWLFSDVARTYLYVRFVFVALFYESRPRARAPREHNSFAASSGARRGPRVVRDVRGNASRACDRGRRTFLRPLPPSPPNVFLASTSERCSADNGPTENPNHVHPTPQSLRRVLSWSLINRPNPSDLFCSFH